MVTWKTRLRITPYFFLLPAMLLLGVFTFYPLTQAVRLSFYKWEIISEPVYSGLQNYRDTFGDLSSGSPSWLPSTTCSFPYRGRFCWPYLRLCC